MAKKKENGKNEPLEKQLWKSADKLRKNIDAAEYKHVVLGLIFLKYISDAFEELFDKLKNGEGEFAGADPEDKDEYKAENVFFVPPSARWSFLQSHAKQPTIGKTVDESMDAIERENPSLKGVLPKVYARQNLDPTSLGELIDLIGKIALGDSRAKSADVLGKVFEYFLGEFALAEGKKGGQFYTPRNVVSLLVDLIQPFNGRVFDPCCGSGGMFVQSEKFILDHQGKINDISIFGQESNMTTWRLAKMNLAIRGIDSSQLKWNNEGSFLNDAHKDLKADFILANPPFNDSEWRGDLLRKDGRWKYGTPPEGNANFAWMQHFLHHLSPKGIGGIVMHGGAASNKGVAESLIRKNFVEGNIVDCIVALPTQLFYNTTLPVHIWILNRAKSEKRKDILMIDAYDLGFMVESTLRELSDDNIEKIYSTYHKWKKDSQSVDEEGFCKSVSIEDIIAKNYILAPNRYVNRKKKVREIPFKESIKSTLENLNTQISFLPKQNGFANISDDSFLHSYIETTNIPGNKVNWNKVELSELIDEIISGSWGNETPKKDNIAVTVLRGTDLPNIPLFNLHKTPTRYINEKKVEEIKLKELDIVIEMSGGSKNQPTGRAAIVTSELLEYFENPLVCSNFCKVIRLDLNKIDAYWFYFYWINSYLNGLTTRYENQPSGIKNFQLDEYLESEIILIPPQEELENYSDYFKSLFEVKNKLSYSSALLQSALTGGFDNIYTDYE